MAVERVAVVGAGTMGNGIAQVLATAEIEVTLVDVAPEQLERAGETIARSLERLVRRDGLTAASKQEILGRIRFTPVLDASAGADLLVEAVVEDLATKQRVLQDGAAVFPETALLVSNTSSISITALAGAVARPERVVGMHFFNPVPVMHLVELIPSLLTAPETAARAEAFADDILGKRVIRSKDRAGFIVNALLIPYLLSAVRMVEAGFATPEDIDRGMVDGCNHPMGPLALCDLIGLDTVAAVADSLYEEFKEPLYASPPLLARMCEAGLLGRKAGEGFYPYDGTSPGR